MRGKKTTALITLSLLCLFALMTPRVISAQEPKISIYLETDKAFYRYGDTGELSIIVWNKATGPIQIESISVLFPWYGLEGRENKTVKDIDTAISGNDTSDPFTVSFTIPTEGRKWAWTADVYVKYILGEEPKWAYDYTEIRVEQLTTQGELLTPIYYSVVAITILLIIAILAVFFVWLSLRKLTLPPAAPVAPAT